MSYVQLIDTNYLFNNTTIDRNVDPELLNPHIIVAQDTNIQQILGYNLLQTIMGMVADNSINDPGNIQYKILLNNYIQPALAHHATWHALPDIQYRMTNKAILSKTTDHSITTGLAELKYLRENVKQYADFYSQRIREQIINNPNDYQQYFATTGIDRIFPKRTTYFAGWSSSGNMTKKKGSNGHGDPDCAGCEPQGYPLNW